MYYPFLYGRQSELLALRDLPSEPSIWNHITPVIEPVNSVSGDLLRCLTKLHRLPTPVFLITNPHHENFRRPGTIQQWRQEIDHYVTGDGAIVIPAFQVSGPSAAEQLPLFIQEFPNRPLGLVLRTRDLTSAFLLKQIRGRDVTIFVHRAAKPRSYLKELPANQTVEVEENFIERARNADYSGIEPFSDSLTEFKKANRPGFSDFGPLPSTFKLGGGQPAAVAIHLSFADDDGDISLQHFVSDSTERGDGDRASKMSEAVAKVAAEHRDNPEKFVRSVGFRQYLDQHENAQPTDLATSKRQQISHHLETVATVLSTM